MKNNFAKLLVSSIQTDEEYTYEDDVQKNPIQLKSWLRYLEVKLSNPETDPNVLNLLFERSLESLPGSYKLWYPYLQLRVKQAETFSLEDEKVWKKANDCFERSLVFMHKMPRIWEEYLKFLMKQQLITKTRQTFDRCLQSLPITQHPRIWRLYKTFLKQKHVPLATVMSVYQRYLMLEPQNIEEYIEEMLERENFEEACIHLGRIVNDESFKSIHQKSKNDLWMELCELISTKAEFFKKLDPTKYLKQALSKFDTEMGQLWVHLATYYLNQGLLFQACDTYEEGMEKIASVKDFGIIFESYSKFLYNIILTKMDQIEKGMQQEPDEEDDYFTFSDDLELWTSKLENLLDRREELNNTVKLAQNPHNVHEWHKRVRIFSEDHLKVLYTYKVALETVDPKMCVGKYFTLWISYAKFQLKNEGIEVARKIFEEAVMKPHKNVDELASIWTEWIELELLNENYVEAHELVQRATVIPKIKWMKEEEYIKIPAQQKLHKSVKLWTLACDLEECFGTIESVCSVYDQMIDLKIVTPQMIVNYANLLEEGKYFELSFKAFEKGIHLFGYPQVYHIWIHYLIKFVKRYKDTKVERSRDLFEQCLSSCPREHSKNIFLLYAKFEEEYGLSKNAMTIYDRSISLIQDSEKMEMFLIYISRASEYFGVSKTRDIYEKAINTLPNKSVRDMCLKYADLERKLGEIDRARAIYIHASNFCDPAVDQKFWELWFEFEKYQFESSIQHQKDN
jgi:pre-mRNA-splicing factor SYF1